MTTLDLLYLGAYRDRTLLDHLVLWPAFLRRSLELIQVGRDCGFGQAG